MHTETSIHEDTEGGKALQFEASTPNTHGYISIKVFCGDELAELSIYPEGDVVDVIDEIREVLLIAMQKAACND